jgi:CheY-like chemotaxis protein
VEHRQPVAHLGENQRAASGHGHTATRQIKTDPAFRSFRIIAVTSFALDGEEQTARAAGCDDYVPEPYSPRQLLAKIQQYMPQ